MIDRLIEEDPIAAMLRARIEFSEQEPISVVAEIDGGYVIRPIGAGTLPVGDIHRLSKPIPKPVNRRARRAQASKARRG